MHVLVLYLVWHAPEVPPPATVTHDKLGLVGRLTLAVVEPYAEVPTARTGNSAVNDDGVSGVTVQILNLPPYVRSEIAHVGTPVTRLECVASVPPRGGVVCTAGGVGIEDPLCLGRTSLIDDTNHLMGCALYVCDILCEGQGADIDVQSPDELHLLPLRQVLQSALLMRGEVEGVGSDALESEECGDDPCAVWSVVECARLSQRSIGCALPEFLEFSDEEVTERPDSGELVLDCGEERQHRLIRRPHLRTVTKRVV